MNKTAATGQEQPARESNINAIVSYFESGIKAFGGPGELGIELEQIIVHDDLSPVSYSGEHGVAWVLRQLAADYPRTTTDCLLYTSRICSISGVWRCVATPYASRFSSAKQK